MVDAGGVEPGAAIISGTRAEPSKKLILNQRPRSPSMSPWSETKTMIGVLGHSAALEHVEDLADLLVDIGDVGEIAAAGAANCSSAECRRPCESAGFQQALGMRVRRSKGMGATSGSSAGQSA